MEKLSRVRVTRQELFFRQALAQPRRGFRKKATNAATAAGPASKIQKSVGKVMFKLYIPIYAVPMERQRINKQGYCYTPERTREFMKQCKMYLSAQYKEKPISRAVRVEIHTFKKREPIAKNYGDVDNLAKSILDSMTGIIFEDDRLVTELTVKKYYSLSSAIIIIVEIL